MDGSQGDLSLVMRQVVGCLANPDEIKEGNDAVVAPDIKSLVCQTCWIGLFSTRAFWKICASEPNTTMPLQRTYDTNFQYPTSTVSILMSQLEISRRTCNWCSLVYKKLDHSSHAFGKYGIPSHTMLSLAARAGESATVLSGIQQVKRKNHYPAGMNDWVVSVALESVPHAWKPVLVDAYTEKMDKASSYVTARPVQVYLQTTSVMPEVNNWLEKCRSHPDCPKQDKVQLPSRLIDVGLEKDSIVKLRSPLKLRWSAGATWRYAALSYCWGGPQDGALTLANLQPYYRAIDITKLSKTIRDAIQVTKAIGCRYLWIDALCIIQDSDEDKLKQIATMNNVYSNAYFTILVESASSAAEGFLPSVQPDLAPHKIPFRCPDGSFGSMSLNYEDRLQYSCNNLETRAWTLQERLLSPRLLRFNSRTVTWSCRGMQCNLGDSSFVQPITGQADSPAASMDDWEALPYDYTRRLYSDRADRLIALGGIAKTRASKYNSWYFAGLWEDDLLEQLLWRHDHTKCEPRPTTYRAPSWSWASIDGRILFEAKCFRTKTVVCEVIECVTTPLDRKVPFGPLVGGWLILEGPVHRAIYPVDGSGYGVEVWEFGRIVDCKIMRDVADTRSQDTADLIVLFRNPQAQWGQVAAGNRVRGLVLEINEGGTYRRVGEFSGLEMVEPTDVSRVVPEPRIMRVKII